MKSRDVRGSVAVSNSASQKGGTPKQAAGTRVRGRTKADKLVEEGGTTSAATEHMAVREKSSQKGGTPKRTPGTRVKGKTKADKKVAAGGTTDAGRTRKRAIRNERIYNRWRRGIDYTTIAQDEKLHPRRVQEICDELRAESLEAFELTSPLVGLKIVDKQLVQLDAAVSTAAEILEHAMADKNWSAAIGASKRLAQAMRERLELQQARGLVPRNLGVLQQQWSGMALVQRILVVFERFGVPDEVGEEVARQIEMSTRKVAGHLQLDTGTPGVELADAEAVA
jgi:hypothetical protein